VAKARWEQAAPHGGGYQYRLCPATEARLTEACFKRAPLEFATRSGHTHGPICGFDEWPTDQRGARARGRRERLGTGA
jgi:hypothetical protein